MIHISISKSLEFPEGKKPLSVAVSLPENIITAVYGSSGAGKTTLLKIVAGLIKPETGLIEVDGTVWLDVKKGVNLPPQQRSIGFVFQDYALFPNMTVLQNLRYAGGKHRDEFFINHLIDIVSLQPFLHARPSQLSGGQQQRVALIRALVRKPQLLLLDEPLAALDSTLRNSLHVALRSLQEQLKFTALLVSHDVGDVYSLAKHMIHLEEGKVLFEGMPQQLFGTANLSSKLQLTGEVLAIIPNGVIYIIELMVATNIIKLTAMADEVKDMNIGDKVLIYAKAFHVGIKKMK